MSHVLCISGLLSIVLGNALLANEELLAEAETELQLGDYQDAQKWFQKLIGQDDLNEDLLVPAIFGMSRVHAEQGEYEKAVDVLKRGVDRVEKSSRLWARLAEIHLETGEHAQARREIRKALDLDSQDLLALLVNAHLLTESGKLEEATEQFRSFVRVYNRLQPTDWQTLVTIGNGAAVYARWESVSQIFRFVVNTLCPDALKDNGDCWQAYVLSGNLLLEKYNEGQALPEFQSALEINPQCVEALVSMAHASLQDSKLDLAEGFAKQALKTNPNHVNALLVLAAVGILSEDEAAAEENLQKALKINPLKQETLGYFAALDILQNRELTPQQCEQILSSQGGESKTEFTEIWTELTQRNPKPGAFLETIAATLDARRKYDHAEVFYRKAIDVMPQLSGPQTSLGMLYMRTGRVAEAQQILDSAFEADPFHVRVSNMRKLINVLNGYDAIASDHFVVRAAESDQLLAKMVSEYLEEIYPELTERYGFEPPVRSQFEIYSSAKDQSGHAWFSTRMIGLPWIQTVGASTGKIVAMTSPNESEEKFNWMRVIRHEFVHVLTLQKTNFNIPHWFTEAISVTEENIAMPVDWHRLLLKRFDNNSLFELATINNGFQKPEGPDDWTLAYCQSFLYAQYMQQEFGEEALRKLLDAYCVTGVTEEALQSAFDIPLDTFETGYRQFIEAKVRSSRNQLPPEVLNFEQAQKLVEESPEDSAAHAQLALAMYAAVGFEQPVLDLIETALKLDSGDPLASALKASHLLSNDNTDEALKVLASSSGSSTQSPIFLRVQAAAFEKAGRIEEAEQVLKLAMARFPLEPRFPKQLNELYELSGAEAEKKAVSLKKLASLDYDDISSRKSLARLYFSTKQYPEAIRWAKEGIAVDALDAETHRILADSYFKNQQTEQGISAYENLLMLDQTTFDDRLQFAKLLRKAKQFDQAKSVLRKLLNEDPDHVEAKTLLKLTERGL